MPASVVYASKNRAIVHAFKAGVSLHSHTNHSRESLDFIRIYAQQRSFLCWIFKTQEEQCRKAKFRLDLDNAYWTPPLTARLAYELERGQIESLDLKPMVSLSDHDNIEAPMLLRVVPEIRRIPVSVEWTAPFGKATFHLGIHNLPSARGQEIMDVFADYTKCPETTRLTEILAMLHEIPGVLVVFNHPLWNLNSLQAKEFHTAVESFLQSHNQFLHAFELNGLRSREENQSVVELATRWNQVVISGGDRHGREPNANLNLTNAESFTEFVDEIRVQRRSQVLFMPQYEEPLGLRFYHTFLDAIRTYSEYPEGMKRWDERTFHPDRNGAISPISALWSAGPPAYLENLLSMAFMVERGPFSSALRGMFGARNTDEIRTGTRGGQEALP